MERISGSIEGWTQADDDREYFAACIVRRNKRLLHPRSASDFTHDIYAPVPEKKVAFYCRTGKFIECYIPPSPIVSSRILSAGGLECPRKPGVERGKGSTKTEEELAVESAQGSVLRARRMIRRLVNCNDLSMLCTLTYAVGHIKYRVGEQPFLLRPVEFTKSRDSVVGDFTAFSRRLRQHGRESGCVIPYVALIELHTGKRSSEATIKQGTYHIHLCTSHAAPISKQVLQLLWRHGLCDVSDWREGTKSRDVGQDDYDGAPVRNPGVYMSKYLGKDFAEDGEKGKRRYWCNRGLKRPLSLSQGAFDQIKKLYKLQEVWRRERVVEIDGVPLKSYYITYEQAK